MKRVFVCSPLSAKLPDGSPDLAGIQRNIQRARLYCLYAVRQGFNPFAPHAFYTEFLDETRAEDRALGIEMGLQELRHRDELWVFLRDGAEPSEGMVKEIALAMDLGIPVIRIRVEDVAEWVAAKLADKLPLVA